MWQQVSGQINTRFPGFLWCYNPGRGGALTLGRNWTLVFLLCYFFQSSCTYGYDSIEHKLITFRKKKGQSLCSRVLSSPLRLTGGKLDSFREVGTCRIHMKVLTEIADDLELKSCESELLMCGTLLIYVSNIPFGYRVYVVNRFTTQIQILNCSLF